MKFPPNKQAFARFAAVVLSLALAFIVGRYDFRPAKRAAEGNQPDLTKSSARTRSRDLLREPPGQSNAVSRTLNLLERLDACQSRGDFIGVIEAIESTADKSEKNRFLAAVFSAWLEKDPLAAIAEVRRVESLRHDALRVAEAFSQWASANPALAAQRVTQLLDGRQKDPTSKPAFLDGIDPPDFLLSMISGLAQADPQLAADSLAKCSASPVVTAGIAILIQDWHPSDADAVRRWAASISNPEIRRVAIDAAATKAGQQEATAPGIAWAMGLADPAERRMALESLSGQWSQRHAAAAFDWTRSLDDESLKLALMPAVLRQLAIIDPGAAADWLNQYEASPGMDASIAAYVRAIQFVNPQAARGSAAAITDPELRDAVQKRIDKVQAQRPSPR